MENRRRTVIFLPEYLCEGDCMLDAFLPLRTFKSEERFGPALGYRRQLEKIACDDQLCGIYVKSPPQKRGRSHRTWMPPNGRSVAFRRL